MPLTTHEPKLEKISFPVVAGLVVALSAGFVSSIGFGLLAPLFALRMDDYGLSPKEIGALVTIIGIAPLFMTPFIPKILNIIPTKKALIIVMILNALLYVTLFFAHTPTIWTVVRIGFAITGTFLFIASESWILEISPPSIRGKIFGLYAVIFYGGIGLGGILISQLGYQSNNVILVAIILNFLCTPLFFLKTRHPSKPHASERLSSIYKLIFLFPALFMPAFAIGGLETSAFNLFPVWSRKQGFDDAFAGHILTAAAIGNVILQFPIGVLGDRIGRKNVLNIIALIAFVLPIGLIFPFSKLFILAIVCLWSGIITGFYTMGLVGIAENFKGDKIATANASFGTTYCISQTLTPSMGGYIMDAFGNSGFMLILSIIGLLPLFLNFFTKNTATSP